MKKHFLFIIVALNVLIVNGQMPDTIGIFTVMSFENSSPYLSIVPLPQNIWQIGVPHKTFFNTAYTLPNAIVTDTMNVYPVNNSSAFELIVGNFNTKDRKSVV